MYLDVVEHPEPQ